MQFMPMWNRGTIFKTCIALVSCDYVRDLLRCRCKRPQFSGGLQPRAARAKQARLSSATINYDMVRPLHDAWRGYIAGITSGDAPVPERLLHADYHGCLLTVAEARNPIYAGITGIVAKVTANTLQIVAPSNRLHGA